MIGNDLMRTPTASSIAFAIAGIALASRLSEAGQAGSRPVLPISLVEPETGRAVEIAPAHGITHVVFFATWCRSCIDEFPAIADLEAAHPELITPESPTQRVGAPPALAS